MTMVTTLPLSKMSTKDKLGAMEELWIFPTAGGSPFPLATWHKAELIETEKRIKSGEEKFIDG